MDGNTRGQNMSEDKRYVSVETVCKEIDRFIGYLDEDMICRLKIAIRRLPGIEPDPWYEKADPLDSFIKHFKD